ncbi:MAG TPA: hypothetical protein ENO13_01490 [Candidatus Bathyarchaeota archaeon]|nr:hypothetical protein [Candidatus Bathyarchaeota archaeon]
MWRCIDTKKLEFEPVDVLHRNWLDYSKNHDINKESETLIPLLNDSSAVMRTQTQILDAIYNATITVLESTPDLDTEEKTRALYLQYNLCECDACQKDYATHINKKGQIRISQKFFQNTLQSPPPAGIMEVMFTVFHQILHGVFPELDEEAITKKTHQVWNSGMNELIKEKIKN